MFYYKQSSVYDVGQPAIKLRRTETTPADMTCLFNYRTYVAALKDYLDDRAPKPDPRCVLVFGQEKPFCRDDPTILVSVTVATSQALEDLKKAESAVSNRLLFLLAPKQLSALSIQTLVRQFYLIHMSSH